MTFYIFAGSSLSAVRLAPDLLRMEPGQLKAAAGPAANLHTSMVTAARLLLGIWHRNSSGTGADM